MTPGINNDKISINDQNYRKIEDVKTDIVIVGRGIYNSEDYVGSAEKYRLR
jgi:3-keto-L-gulonate-6-phosphate decarboxylase